MRAVADRINLRIRDIEHGRVLLAQQVEEFLIELWVNLTHIRRANRMRQPPRAKQSYPAGAVPRPDGLPDHPPEIITPLQARQGWQDTVLNQPEIGHVPLRGEKVQAGEKSMV